MCDRPMTKTTLLQNDEDLQAMLERSEQEAVLLLKHSNSCPISSAGYRQFEAVAERDYPMYMVVVQEARAVSNAIAEQLNVFHQTPQAIIVHQGKAVFDLSHYRIRTDALTSEMDRLAGSGA